MSNDFVRWFPMAAGILQLVFLPVLIVALNAQIDTRVEKHNSNLYAHPALSDLRELEQKIEDLAKAVQRLELVIAKLSDVRSRSEE